MEHSLFDGLPGGGLPEARAARLPRNVCRPSARLHSGGTAAVERRPGTIPPGGRRARRPRGGLDNSTGRARARRARSSTASGCAAAASGAVAWRQTTVTAVSLGAWCWLRAKEAITGPWRVIKRVHRVFHVDYLPGLVPGVGRPPADRAGPTIHSTALMRCAWRSSWMAPPPVARSR